MDLTRRGMQCSLYRLLLFLVVEAMLLMAAALHPRWAAVYVFVGAVVLYWFAVHYGNTRKATPAQSRL